ncbi:hypothetical protein F4821DRAFT_242371 [Hypoxylon rubiginosum]|uniref:Uncharacterized protein n=1 Tax=Hypoxylon rubiginosum TaxID=110542 RepID=A0ACC0CX09_9PEZI|nr:hypothetical protein F4821DRAFT_242371 [Hypoxylon rubiginosum]
MDPDLDAGLFDIHLSDSEDGANDAEPAEGGQPQRQEAEAPADRTAQSEEEFQSVRKGYVVKVENGEVWKSIKLPLGTGRLPKPEAQALLHAVEELYFFRRYAEGARFVRTVLDGDRDGDEAPELDNDTRKLLRYYEKKCNEKTESS